MAPTSREIGFEMASELIRGSKGGGVSKKPPGKPPRFLSARIRNFFVVFNWAWVNDDVDSFIYAVMAVFVFSVIATIAMHVLSEFERVTLLRRRSDISPWERLRAGLAYMARMGLMYILIVGLMSQNLWVLVSVLCGHFVGWVIFSSIDGKATEKARVQATISALRQEEEERKRKKQKVLEDEIDLEIDEDDDDDDYSDCSSVHKHK